MYLRHCLLVYGWQGQCLHFVLQRGAEWLLVSPLPELWYWAFLLPDYGITCRTSDIYTMEVSLDIVVFYFIVYCICRD